MARTIFVPTAAGAIIPSGMTVDRGQQLVDLLTKSTFSKAVAFTDTNACGEDSFRKASASLNISQLLNCVPTQNSTVSLSVSVPLGTTPAQMNVLIDYVQSAVIAAIGIPIL